MSMDYIDNHYSDIEAFENIVEKRLPDTLPTKEELVRENKEYLEQCCQYGLNYILIDDAYPKDLIPNIIKGGL